MDEFSFPDLTAFWLTFRLALTATIFLLVCGTPLAWWLATTRSRFKPLIETITALPLVLPPTVLGFYLLILMNPTSPIGAFWLSMTGSTLTFSFAGLVIASAIYSLPFMVQPLQATFEAIGHDTMEAAASLRASPIDRFFSVAAPMSARGFLTASILTFAHTIGEFGIVLMVGGNIPGRTQVVSIEIYDYVETMEYGQANTLSILLVLMSFMTLLVVYSVNRRTAVRVG